MPVMVRNLKPGPTVFSIPEDRIQIEWKGKGDPTGGDIQEVPESVLENAHFRHAIRRGLLLQVTEDEALESLDRQTQAYLTHEAASSQQAVDLIDRVANKDIVSTPCQGPGARGTGLCGAPVGVIESQKGEAPVLCPLHESLAGSFIQAMTGNMIEKGDALVPETYWVLPTMTAREAEVNLAAPKETAR